jgi:hypothetical protein
MEVSGQLYALVSLLPGKEPVVKHWTGGWVGLRTNLDAVAKRRISYPCREKNPGRPAHNLVTILTELSRVLISHHVGI